MKLPNCSRLTVPERKVRLYLLNPAHPTGGGKAKFFLQFGFIAREWNVLALALAAHAQENDFIEVTHTSFGKRYVIDGRLIAPDGNILNIRAAWYMDDGSDVPRFVTAHPLPK
jgi:hypothetical protein